MGLANPKHSKGMGLGAELVAAVILLAAPALVLWATLTERIEIPRWAGEFVAYGAVGVALLVAGAIESVRRQRLRRRVLDKLGRDTQGVPRATPSGLRDRAPDIPAAVAPAPRPKSNSNRS